MTEEEKKELIETLEKDGLKFGKDFNEETIEELSSNKGED